MAFKVRHEYAVGDTWQQYWLGRNGGMVMPTARPESYWARIDTTLGLPAFELRYGTNDPPSDGSDIRRNQITNPRISKSSPSSYVPVSGELAFWGFRVRYGPATTFGSSFLNNLSHTSFGAIDSGPTFFGKTAGSSQSVQVIYNRGTALALVPKPTTYWLDVKYEYLTHPTAGRMRVWTKRHDEPASSFVLRLNVSNIDSYGLSNDINQITWGIYEYISTGRGNYDCNALQRLGIATTEAEINDFLAPSGSTPVVTAPGTPANVRIVSVGNGSVRVASDAVSGGLTGDGYQFYVNDAWDGVTYPSPDRVITTTATGVALVNGTPYTFRMSFGGSTQRPTAEQYSGWSPVTALSATPTATPTTPAVPTGLRVIGVGDKQVILDWNDNTDVFGQYQVYRDGVLIASGLTQSSYTDNDPGLLNGNTYSYQVRAGSTGNQSALSAAVTATPNTDANPVSTLTDEFTSYNAALWPTLIGTPTFNGRAIFTPTSTQPQVQITTDASWNIQAGEEVRVTDVIPLQGSSSATRFYLSVLLGTSDTRVSFRVLNSFLSRRSFLLGSTAQDVDTTPYDSATMKNFGVRFPTLNSVEYFTETTAGVRTVHETRTLPFSFAGSTARVAIGVSVDTFATVDAPMSVEAINPAASAVTGANLDPAEEKRLLDDSLVPGTSYQLRLTSTAPTATTAGTQLSGGGYAAQTVQFTDAASTGTKQFTAIAVFPSPTADWQTISGFEVWTTGGTPVRKWLKAYGPPEQRTLTAGGPAYRVPASTTFRLN